MLASGFSGIAEFVVDGVTVGLLVLEAPEIEAANLVSLELFGDGDGGIEDLVLLFKVGQDGGVVAFLRAGFGARRAGPVDLEEWAANVGDAQVVLRKDGLRAGDFVGVKLVDGLVPEVADLDPPEAEVVGGDGEAWSKSSEISSVMTLILNGDLRWAKARMGAAKAAVAQAAVARKLRRVVIGIPR